MGWACKSTYWGPSPAQTYQKAKEIWMVAFHLVESYNLICLCCLPYVDWNNNHRTLYSSPGPKHAPALDSYSQCEFIPAWHPGGSAELCMAECETGWPSKPDSSSYWDRRCRHHHHHYWKFLSKTLERCMTASFWEVVFEVMRSMPLGKVM